MHMFQKVPKMFLKCSTFVLFGDHQDVFCFFSNVRWTFTLFLVSCDFSPMDVFWILTVAESGTAI